MVSTQRGPKGPFIFTSVFGKQAVMRHGMVVLGVLALTGCKSTVEDEIARLHRLSAQDGVTFASSVFYLKKEMSVHASWQLESSIPFDEYCDRLPMILPEYKVSRKNSFMIELTRQMPGDIFLMRVERLDKPDRPYRIDVSFTAFPS